MRKRKGKRRKPKASPRNRPRQATHTSGLAKRVAALEQKIGFWARLPLFISAASLIAFVLDMTLLDTLKFKNNLNAERSLVQLEHNYDLTYHIRVSPLYDGEVAKFKSDVTVMNLGTRDMKVEEFAKLKVAFTEHVTWELAEDLNEIVKIEGVKEVQSVRGDDFIFTLLFDQLGTNGTFRIVFFTAGKLIYLPQLALGNASFDPVVCLVDDSYVLEENCAARIKDEN